ncbi:hypothetical protein AA0535_2640 [Asaia krungthepensis NRIC 0535]|uniref:Uncharacterized protein n=1 Tax=Asaia krungthepensis NRIC 0535 TaxID=1307925 RepID=A0ABQ0Q5X1_9PROT|nr:hypothetical protein AA0535_2640 [Asaia krungthepensis NRIC 0535]
MHGYIIGDINPFDIARNFGGHDGHMTLQISIICAHSVRPERREIKGGQNAGDHDHGQKGHKRKDRQRAPWRVPDRRRSTVLGHS